MRGLILSVGGEGTATHRHSLIPNGVGPGSIPMNQCVDELVDGVDENPQWSGSG